MEIVRCARVTKVYGSGEGAVTALRDLDLSVDEGEFVAVVGASGSGKSTLLHILGSVERPSSGLVRVAGTELGSLSAAQAAVFRRRSASLIYQFYNLIPTLTVGMNIQLPLLLDRKKPDKGALLSLAEELGIADKLEALPQQLSGGQQQRAAIARALLSRPAVLLADEPTGNLDSRNTREILALLREANRARGQTVLLITHDEGLAASADRLLTLSDGRLVRDEWREGAPC